MQGDGIPLSEDSKHVSEKQEALVLIPMSEVEAANHDLGTEWEQALWVNCYSHTSVHSPAMRWKYTYNAKGRGDTVLFVPVCVDKKIYTMCIYVCRYKIYTL